MNAPAPRVLVADDEPALAEYLRGRLAALWPEASLLPLARNGIEALAALASGAAEGYGLHKRLAAVQACRTVKKTDMLHNDYLPLMQIDAQTYEVRADGQLLTCEPAMVLPMAQRYFLF